MTETVLRFRGLKVETGSRVTDAQFALRNKQWLGGIVVIGIVLAVLTSSSYRRDASEMLTPFHHRVLTALRLCLLGMLALLLLRPVLAYTIESTIRRAPCSFSWTPAAA